MPAQNFVSVNQYVVPCRGCSRSAGYTGIELNITFSGVSKKGSHILNQIVICK